MAAKWPEDEKLPVSCPRGYSCRYENNFCIYYDKKNKACILGSMGGGGIPYTKKNHGGAGIPGPARGGRGIPHAGEEDSSFKLHFSNRCDKS